MCYLLHNIKMMVEKLFNGHRSEFSQHVYYGKDGLCASWQFRKTYTFSFIFFLFSFLNVMLTLYFILKLDMFIYLMIKGYQTILKMAVSDVFSDGQPWARQWSWKTHIHTFFHFLLWTSIYTNIEIAVKLKTHFFIISTQLTIKTNHYSEHTELP